MSKTNFNNFNNSQHLWINYASELLENKQLKIFDLKAKKINLTN